MKYVGHLLAASLTAGGSSRRSTGRVLELSEVVVENLMCSAGKAESKKNIIKWEKPIEGLLCLILSFLLYWLSPQLQYAEAGSVVEVLGSRSTHQTRPSMCGQLLRVNCSSLHSLTLQCLLPQTPEMCSALSTSVWRWAAGHPSEPGGHLSPQLQNSPFLS